MIINTTDIHDVPAIIVSRDGDIIIVKESLEPGGTHNSYVEFWKSNAAETIEDPTSPGSHYFTKVTRFETGSYGKYSYPRLQQGVAENEILCYFRTNSGGHHHLVVARSQDNGSTWKDLSGNVDDVTQIAECEDIAGAGLDWYFYCHSTKGPEGTYGYNMFFQLNEGYLGNSPDGTLAASCNKYIGYLQSDDGITWNNFARYYNGTGGFSKNVVNSGSITSAELKANCILRDISTDARESYTIFDSWINKEGIPYALVNRNYRYDDAESPNYGEFTKGYKSNIVIDVFVLTYDTVADAWIEVSVMNLGREKRDPYSTLYSTHALRPTLVAYEGETMDVVIRRLVDQYGDYEYSFPEITASADLVKGMIYRVTATAANNFGDGVVIGDLYYYSGSATPTVDASNKLLPVRVELTFWRTRNNGGDWYQIREPYIMNFQPYASNNPGIASSSNMHDSKYLTHFVATPVKLDSSGTCFDHSMLTMFIDKIQI